MRPLWSDGKLVRGSLKGDGRSAEELVRRHYARAWRAALAVTGQTTLADDAAQDAFERAINRLDRFDRSRLFGPWIGRIAVNCALDIVAGRAREVSMGDALLSVADRHTSEMTDEQMDLVRALGELPVDHRATVVLRLYVGLAAAETAEALGVEVGTVHSRLSRARGQLRQLLEERTDV